MSSLVEILFAITLLAAGPATLEEADSDKPSIDHSCWGRLADCGLVIGEHVPFLVDPAAEVGGTGSHHDVSFQLAPIIEGTAVGEAYGQATAPVPAEVLPVVELQRDAEVVVGDLGVLLR